MTLEAIAALASVPIDPTAPIDATAGITAAPNPVDGAFDALIESLQTLNTQMLSGQQAVSQLALGQTDNLHQVMMQSEQTRLSFELMLAVRNKVLDAYQELMRMQV
jgi:flagellar hook-basal body complex protein FliE